MQNSPSNLSAQPTDNQNSVQMTDFEKKIQLAMNKFVLAMQKLGLNNEALNVVCAKLLAVTEERTMLKVLSVLSNDEVTQWHTKTETSDDPLYKLSVLDTYYQKRTGQSIEELQSEIVIGLIDSTISTLVERPALEEKFKKLNLTDDQAEEFIQLIASGDLDAFENKLSSIAQ